MTDNRSLWDSVSRTDPSHVVEIRGKPYKGNSPKPHWLILKATETFGPCGIGWGFSIIDDRVEAGAPGDRLHIAKVRVWYEWEGKRGEVEHVGGTKMVGKDKNGPFSDEDAAKKSVTDALVKALSMIGFAGDIFLGRWDDSKYQAELREEFSEKPAFITPEEVEDLDTLLVELGEEVTEGFKKFFKIEFLGRLPATEFNTAMNLLLKKKQKALMEAAQ